MACETLIVAVVCFLCGTLLGMHRSKLKSRYLFALGASTSVIVLYVMLPDCTTPLDLEVEVKMIKPLSNQGFADKAIQSRGLLHDNQERSVRKDFRIPQIPREVRPAGQNRPTGQNHPDEQNHLTHDDKVLNIEQFIGKTQAVLASTRQAPLPASKVKANANLDAPKHRKHSKHGADTALEATQRSVFPPPEDKRDLEAPKHLAEDTRGRGHPEAKDHNFQEEDNQEQGDHHEDLGGLHLHEEDDDLGAEEEIHEQEIQNQEEDEEEEEEGNGITVLDVAHENEETANEEDENAQTNNENHDDVEAQSPQQENDDVKEDKDDVIIHLRKHSDVGDQLSKFSFDDEFRKRYIVDLEPNNGVLMPFMKPQEVQQKYADVLPWWEMKEVQHYPQVWFAGIGANKTKYNSSSEWNYGFDKSYDADHEGRFIITKEDHLAYRYKIVRKLGAGSYGVGILAEDMALAPDHPDHMVAVKILHNDSSVKKYFKKEFDILFHVTKETGHPERFSKILRTFFFRNHLCIVFELLGHVLDEEVEPPISDLNILHKYASDILTSLVLLHRKNIIHGDLKPSNIMFARGCNLSCPNYVKLADFNLACVPHSKDFACTGRYFQTRYYRAPEVILDLDYDVTADMWSVGVIMAELFTGQVPFYGESSTDQLAAIMEVVGLVPPYMVETSPRIKTYQKAVCYVCENGFKRVPYRKKLASVIKGAPPVLYDFIKRCFELDPKKRMTSYEALKHPFITRKKYHSWGKH